MIRNLLLISQLRHVYTSTVNQGEIDTISYITAIKLRPVNASAVNQNNQGEIDMISYITAIKFDRV